MGAREGREVAVRSVHQIAVEQDDRARLADGSHYAVGMGELSETILVRHTIFLLLERYFVMVVRSFAYAGQKDPMRTRRSEERRVGKEGVSTCRSGWSPCQSQKNKRKQKKKKE